MGRRGYLPRPLSHVRTPEGPNGPSFYMPRAGVLPRESRGKGIRHITSMVETTEIQIGDQTLHLEYGRVGKQANGAVLARSGDTVVFAAATMSREPRAGIDFFPLTCDYEERMYSVGKIPGGFYKREGRPSER